jgi:predicted dehydrogenase
MFRLSAVLLVAASCPAQEIRVGIIGTDTSHVPAFTALLNGTGPERVPGARVVAAWKGGSPDLQTSRDRVDKYAAEIREKWGVRIVDTIEELLRECDAILLESVDGRVHLEQYRKVAASRKPVFIDKPLSATWTDAEAIYKLGREHNAPWFSTSSLRYAEMLAPLKANPVRSAIVWGPGPEDPTHTLQLSWYGVHPIEMLYTLMGTGCARVSQVHTGDSDIITGEWKDGRTGTVKTLRPYGDFGAVAFSDKGVATTPPGAKVDYREMVVRIVEFFRTKQPPVPNDETLEVFAFMEAARLSREQGGRPVPLPQMR